MNYECSRKRSDLHSHAIELLFIELRNLGSLILAESSRFLEEPHGFLISTIIFRLEPFRCELDFLPGRSLSLRSSSV